MFDFRKQLFGFSLIEVLVVISITTLIFGGLFTAFEYSLRLTGQSKAKLTALSLATDRLEYIRSLPYDSVGTVSGIPNGAIPQNRTVNLNGLDFSERVLIEFVDDPADGINAADSNGILSDYKRVKIEYTWNIMGNANQFSIAGTIVPRSIETTAGGGTLRVNVFDASVLPLANISVRLLNVTTTSTIDVTRQTDTSGTAYFTGAPAAANYQIFVFSSGYSSDQTYEATTTLPNPFTLPVAVLEGDISTMNFQIDRLGELNIKFVDSQVIDSETENFSDLSGVSTSTFVVATSGVLRLSETGGVYESSGFAWLNPITPTQIVSWGMGRFSTNVTPQTEAKIQFYTSADLSTLIGDADLPGNAAGFTGPYINLQSLQGNTFPTLVPRIILSTTNNAITPELDEWNIEYIETETVVASEPFDITGSKNIGTLGGGALVPKFSLSTSTNALGEISIPDAEWDQYNILPASYYVVAEACKTLPLDLAPNTTENLRVLLDGATANTLRVTAKTGAGATIPDATVQLTHATSSFSATQTTGWCGQAFFSGIASEVDYRLDVSASGYTTTSINPFSISGQTVQDVILIP